MMVVMWMDVDVSHAIGVAVIVVVAYLFAHFRLKNGAVKMEDSFEAL